MNYLVKMLLLLLLCYPVLASPCSFVCSLLQLPMTFNPNCSEWRKTTSQEVQEISAQDVLLLYFYFLFFCFSCLNMYYVCGCSFCKTFWRGRRERERQWGSKWQRSEDWRDNEGQCNSVFIQKKIALEIPPMEWDYSFVVPTIEFFLFSLPPLLWKLSNKL